MESFRAPGVLRTMPRPYRRILPTATLPRVKPQRKGGVAFAVALHIGIIGLLIWEPAPVVNDEDGIGGPGARGGGGGGGAGAVTFIQMPAYRQPSSQLTFRVEVAEPRPEVTIQPEIMVSPNLSRTTRPNRQIATRTIGSERGTGEGLGRGTGSGGGVGSGEGTGTGSATGPGTGGGGGSIFPPSPRNISLPPQPIPGELKGKAFDVRFWVDENGIVTNVTVSPRVEQSDYRERWIRQLRDFVFNPATSADGTPIPGEFPMTVRLS